MIFRSIKPRGFEVEFKWKGYVHENEYEKLGIEKPSAASRKTSH
jgi:hypothetical protein